MLTPANAMPRRRLRVRKHCGLPPAGAAGAGRPDRRRFSGIFIGEAAGLLMIGVILRGGISTVGAWIDWWEQPAYCSSISAPLLSPPCMIT